MDIIRIFDGDIPPLSSFKFEDEELNEFERLFDLWHDTEYLRKFFEDNEGALKSGFFGDITIKQAIDETIKDADWLEDYLIDIVEGNDRYTQLDDVFQELSGGTAVELSRTKIYGRNKNRNSSWLRVYALKIDSNVYIVTGGAIKLTLKMGDAPDTKKELEKFKRCIDFLNDNTILEASALRDFFNEQ
jgi:hypothetical protein